MKIEITTPEKHFASDLADEVYASGPKGEFGILPGYVHYVTPLHVSHLRYSSGGKTHSFMLSGGFMEVFEDCVHILADDLEEKTTIDAGLARQRVSEIEKQLSQDGITPEKFEELNLELEKNQARVQVAGSST